MVETSPTLGSIVITLVGLHLPHESPVEHLSLNDHAERPTQTESTQSCNSWNLSGQTRNWSDPVNEPSSARAATPAGLVLGCRQPSVPPVGPPWNRVPPRTLTSTHQHTCIHSSRRHTCSSPWRERARVQATVFYTVFLTVLSYSRRTGILDSSVLAHSLYPLLFLRDDTVNYVRHSSGM
ncbi:hypothetical protein CBL_01644 [Carabus blaptoides fortunei]